MMRSKKTLLGSDGFPSLNNEKLSLRMNMSHSELSPSNDIKSFFKKDSLL